MKLHSWATSYFHSHAKSLEYNAAARFDIVVEDGNPLAASSSPSVNVVNLAMRDFKTYFAARACELVYTVRWRLSRG